MVATVIMVVLVGLVVQITSEVLKVWNRSSGKLAANAEARIAMDILTQDLETAVFRNNGQQWFRVEAPLPTAGNYTDQTVGLKLFTPALDRPLEYPAGIAIPGDICAVGYRLEFKESYLNGPSVFALYRKVVDARETFNDYMGSQSQGSTSRQASMGPNSLADWSDATITNSENYLVSNIIEFKILLYEEDATSTVTLEPLNADARGMVTDTYAFGGVPDGAAVVNTGPLLYADIILTVVSDEGLRLLENFADIGAFGGYTSLDEIVTEFGEVFTRRVNFLARPL
jgi:type II secretory pathway component PulJ